MIDLRVTLGSRISLSLVSEPSTRRPRVVEVEGSERKMKSLFSSYT